MTKSELRKKYGIKAAPVSVSLKVRVLKSEARPFDHDMDVRSWAVIDPKGRIYRANTYDGNLGRNQDPTGPANSEVYSEGRFSEYVKMGYGEVDPSECPFIQVEGDEGGEAPVVKVDLPTDPTPEDLGEATIA